MPAVTEEWADTAVRQLRNQRTGYRKLLDKTNAQIRLAEKALAGMREVRKGLEDRIERYGNALDDLNLMREDPPVLVRITGKGSYAYHDADEPCGWVRDESHYEAVLWGEARAAGKTPCTSCGHRADRIARQSSRRRGAEAEAS